MHQRAERVTASSDLLGAEALLNDFVESVRGLPQVLQVLAEGSASSLVIWTALTAEPPDQTERYAVYDAELAAMDAHPEVRVKFELVNLAEYPGTPLDHLLPAQARRCFAR